MLSIVVCYEAHIASWFWSSIFIHTAAGRPVLAILTGDGHDVSALQSISMYPLYYENGYAVSLDD